MALRIFQPKVHSGASPDLRLLNVGCGRHYDRRWVNLDLKSNDPEVLLHDVTRGIPFEAEQFDAVYHSHILEHLKPHRGKELIQECYRVLRPGGVMRIVVPDLEKIASLYLENHEKAWNEIPNAQTNFDWMKLELLDQLVRGHSGGRMGPYMASAEIKNSEFVRWRVGNEFEICRGEANEAAFATRSKSIIERLRESTRQIRERVAFSLIRICLGKRGVEALDEGLFRSGGEIHRWMYDRFSLRRLCAEHGFVNFQVCQAHESRINDFSDYQLDTVGAEIRKPDSLFIECQKPREQLGNRNPDLSAA